MSSFEYTVLEQWRGVMQCRCPEFPDGRRQAGTVLEKLLPLRQANLET
jgi:hypothetical protein